jgi:hypothetical protein
LDSYSKMLGSLNLIELQDHAYEMGVLAGPDKHSLVDRLERKFIQDHAKFAPGLQSADDPSLNADPDMRAAAEKTISRGR